MCVCVCANQGGEGEEERRKNESNECRCLTEPNPKKGLKIAKLVRVWLTDSKPKISYSQEWLRIEIML